MRNVRAQVRMTRVMLLSAVFVATATVAAGSVDALLATNPVTEAEQAFAAGDRRYIVVPVCASGGGDVLPGWPLTYSPAHLEAIEKGKKPITCTEIGDDPSGEPSFVFRNTPNSTTRGYFSYRPKEASDAP